MGLCEKSDMVSPLDILCAGQLIRTNIDAHDFLMSGVPVSSLFDFFDHFMLPETLDALEKSVGVILTTAQRERRTLADVDLTLDQGSRLWTFVGLLSRAINVFGSQRAAEDWLNKPAIGLRNRKPVELMMSSVGVKAVEAYLTQIDLGVYV